MRRSPSDRAAVEGDAELVFCREGAVEPRVSIIVPAFNEVGTIARVVDRLLAVEFGSAHEVIVVDDGSTDGTVAALRRLPGETGHLSIVQMRRNRGKGSAVRTGLAWARGEVSVIQDADLEYDPQELPALVDPILQRRAGVVYGSRFLQPTDPVPWLSLAANRFLTMLTNLLYGSSLTDMETCYKVVPTDVLRGLDLTAQGFELEPEITAKLLRSGQAIHECAIGFHPRSRAQGKKIGWRDGVRAVATLVRYRFWRPR